MRTPTALLVVRTALALLLSGVLLANQPRQAEDVDLVEVDVVVVDGKGKAVHGLAATDFSLHEDGKPVTVTTFEEVSGPAPDDPDAARSIVLLLDDTGVGPTGTQAIQAIARAFISSAAPIDEIPVVRLHKRGDEPFGDRLAAEARIRDYRGGASPFAFGSTTRELLERVSEISEAVASNTSRRRVIVCIGSPYICNVQEPLSTSPRAFESSWTAALSAAARANVAVYAVVPGNAPFRGGGLPEFTGGDVFASTYDFGPPIDRILQDASNYYILGYWPDSAVRALHRVEVKVGKRGVRVRARHRR